MKSFKEIKNKVHDASGIHNPYMWTWEQENGIYYPTYKFDLVDLLTDNLEVIETTRGNNGYPKEIREAIIGFKTFEEAENFASEHGLEVQDFTKRKGHDLWHRERKNHVFSAIEVRSEMYGDDYILLENDTTKEELSELVQEKEDYDQIEMQLDNLSDDNYVIVKQGMFYDTVGKKVMEFSHDGKTTVIGVAER